MLTPRQLFGIVNWALADRAAYQGLGSANVETEKAEDASKVSRSRCLDTLIAWANTM